MVVKNYLFTHILFINNGNKYLKIHIDSQKVRIFHKGQNSCVLMSMSHELWKINVSYLKF